MNFFKRFSYYLLGFTLGMFFLFYLMDQKDATFNYSPNKRVLADILKKEWKINDFNNTLIKKSDFLKNFQVDFSRSNTKLDSCKKYIIYSKIKTENIFEVVNCKVYASFTML